MTEVSTPVQTRGFGGFLTLQYVGASVSTVIATVASINLFADLFSMWTNSFSSTSVAVLGGFSYTNTVTLAVVAAVFSVIAFLLYRRVSKGVALRLDYIKRLAYVLVTNAMVGVFTLLAVVVAAVLVATLISSLLLIGTGTDIGGMYLNQFLPGFVSLGFIVCVGWMLYLIAKGKNMSLPLTIILMSVAAALFIATLITVPIKAHDTNVNVSNTLDLNKYMQDFSRY